MIAKLVYVMRTATLIRINGTEFEPAQVTPLGFFYFRKCRRRHNFCRAGAADLCGSCLAKWLIDVTRHHRKPYISLPGCGIITSKLYTVPCGPPHLIDNLATICCIFFLTICWWWHATYKSRTPKITGEQKKELFFFILSKVIRGKKGGIYSVMITL